MALVAAAVLAACGPERVATLPVAPVRNCAPTGAVVAWHWSPGPSQRAVLDRWCESVGGPVVTNVGAPPAEITRLVIVSWNMHVGLGRLAELADLIRRHHGGPLQGTAVVVLLQEAFRRGADVPPYVPNLFDVPGAILQVPRSPDIVELARRLDLSLGYVPSMRNGPATDLELREDRGSAILSTEPLGDVTAIELPFGRQRRVAVMATVRPRGRRAKPLRVISAHLDLLKGTSAQAKALAEFVDDLGDDPIPVVLGIDTNAFTGRRHAAVKTLSEELPLETCGEGRTGPWIARLDFIFSNLTEPSMKRCTTLPDRHGSDHLPLLLELDYRQPPA